MYQLYRVDQRVCKFWNPDKVDPNCEPKGSDVCKGAWDTEGVELVNKNPNDDEASSNVTVCRTTHLSEFGVEIDFTISKPSISAKNFDFSNSQTLYIFFGSFAAFIGVIVIYSWLERRAYDRRELMIEAGLIEEPLPAPPGPPDMSGLKRFWLYRSLVYFLNGLKTKVSS